MFPVLRYFCLLIPWSFTESEKTSIIPFSVKKCKRGEAVIWISKNSLSAMYPRIC